MTLTGDLSEVWNWNRFLACEFESKEGRAIIESLDLSSLTWSEALPSYVKSSSARQKRLDSTRPTEVQLQATKAFTYQAFPERVLACGHFPMGLLAQGDPGILRAPTVAIVGTRKCTGYGRVCAHRFAQDLARAGVTIISGGAMGIDGAAHEGALAANGKTAAILGGGLDVVYPAIHGPLFERIRQNGCLLSPYAFGVPTADFRFLQRNILVSTFADAVLVIECPQKSGALRTAGYAAELGKEVFVIPGQIDHMGFHGSHALIRDGATLVQHPDQILEVLRIEPSERDKPTVDGDAGTILSVLKAEPQSVEKISEQTGLSSADILTELTMLELEGRILKQSGGYSIR